jgi:2'-5' RNA ligase
MPLRRSRNAPPAQYSVWLLPDTQSEARLLETVARLSVLLGGPGFVPHLTVQGDIALPMERIHALVERMARQCGPLCWTVGRVECSPHFFRSLYLRFPPMAEFAQLQQLARRQTATAQGLSPFPHLSLAYGDTHPGNTGLCDILAEEFNGQQITFDQIAVCRSSKSVPIPQWECLVRFPLTLT